jgi:hypothetical protein
VAGGSVEPVAVATPGGTPEELERLRRELGALED